MVNVEAVLIGDYKNVDEILEALQERSTFFKGNEYVKTQNYKQEYPKKSFNILSDKRKKIIAKLASFFLPFSF